VKGDRVEVGVVPRWGGLRDKKWLLEHENLSVAGTRSDSEWTSRKFDEGERRAGLRLPFQRDRDRIIHCESFRCLMHKTQVFPSPHLAQYRTRLTHTIEVAQIARAISRALGLNEDLAEAIALGHDLGHTPFGHVGEDALRAILLQDRKELGLPDREGFEHNEHSLVIVDTTEQADTVHGPRSGMNLTKATRQGILCHTLYREQDYAGQPKQLRQEWKELGYSSREERERKPELLQGVTPEAQVVDISDEIGYLTHDLEDCRRAGILQETEVPAELQQFVAERRKDALHDLIDSVITESRKEIAEAESTNTSGAWIQIKYRPQVTQLIDRLRRFFEEYVFQKEELARLNNEAKYYIEKLFEYWMRNPPPNMNATPGEIARFIARKTDQEIIQHYQEKFTPRLF